MSISVELRTALLLHRNAAGLVIGTVGGHWQVSFGTSDNPGLVVILIEKWNDAPQEVMITFYWIDGDGETHSRTVDLVSDGEYLSGNFPKETMRKFWIVLPETSA